MHLYINKQSKIICEAAKEIVFLETVLGIGKLEGEKSDIGLQKKFFLEGDEFKLVNSHEFKKSLKLLNKFTCPVCLEACEDPQDIKSYGKCHDCEIDSFERGDYEEE